MPAAKPDRKPPFPITRNERRRLRQSAPSVASAAVTDTSPCGHRPTKPGRQLSSPISAVGRRLNDDAAFDAQGAIHPFGGVDGGVSRSHVGGAGTRGIAIERSKNMNLAGCRGMPWVVIWETWRVGSSLIRTID
jgi:hypothetical protein